MTPLPQIEPQQHEKRPNQHNGWGALSVVVGRICIMQYDPWNHVDELGVSVGWHPLRHSNGLWLPSKKRIILNTRLPEWAIRPILAHEAVHAEYNDPPGRCPKVERRCDRIAAFRLIHPERLHYLSKVTANYDEICIELGVTRPMLIEYVNSIPWAA